MVKITFDDAPEIEATDILSVSLTERASERIEEILTKENMTGHILRVRVEGGGCSGFSYKFKLEEPSQQEASDIVITHPSRPHIKVVIDMMSFNYIKGSSIDFEETLEASQFIINNPNASSSCGCGHSFSL